MELKKFLHDDDAVSPVIGVILMVAITVILAAVIASFVLGLGDTTQQTPTASFSFDYEQTSGTGDSLTITHDGGDTIPASRLSASTSGITDGAATSPEELTYSGTLFTSSGDVSSGTSDTIDGSSGADFVDSGGNNDAAEMDGGTVRVVYESQSGENSATLSTWEGPDA
jgi:flagellin-like protein